MMRRCISAGAIGLPGSCWRAWRQCSWYWLSIGGVSPRARKCIAWLTSKPLSPVSTTCHPEPADLSTYDFLKACHETDGVNALRAKGPSHTSLGRTGPQRALLLFGAGSPRSAGNKKYRGLKARFIDFAFWHLQGEAIGRIDIDTRCNTQ